MPCLVLMKAGHRIYCEANSCLLSVRPQHRPEHAPGHRIWPCGCFRISVVLVNQEISTTGMQRNHQPCIPANACDLIKRRRARRCRRTQYGLVGQVGSEPRNCGCVMVRVSVGCKITQCPQRRVLHKTYSLVLVLRQTQRIAAPTCIGAEANARMGRVVVHIQLVWRKRGRNCPPACSNLHLCQTYGIYEPRPGTVRERYDPASIRHEGEIDLRTTVKLSAEAHISD